MLQALHRMGVFRHIDYLSTVSGGGFIGAALSSRLADVFYRRRAAGGAGPPPAPDDAFPFPVPAGDVESLELSHLRNHSNYLLAGGISDLFRLLAVLLRGIILNSLALFPFLLMMSLVVVLGYGQQLSDRSRFDDQVERIDGLLGRYFGAESDEMPEFETLLGVLENEALLRLDQGRTRFDLIHELRPPLALEPRQRRGLLRRRADADRELVTGSGTETNPYTLSPQATRKDVATALLVADVLQPDEVIREIELLTRLVEEEGYSHCAECVGDLLGVLRRRGLIREPTDDPELLAFLGGRKSVGRSGPWATGSGDRAAGYRWRASLRQVLQALYNGEYLAEVALRATVESELQREPYYGYGWYAGRVGQLYAGGWYAEADTEDPEAAPAAAVEVRASPLGSAPAPVRLKGALHSQLLRAEAEVGTLARQLEASALPFDRLDLAAILDRLAALAPEGSEVLRHGTTPDDVGRLMRFEELSRSDQPLVLLPGTPLREVIGLLYRGGYLARRFVHDRLAAQRSESERLAEALVRAGFPADCAADDLRRPGCATRVSELLALLEPEPSVLPSDLLRLLRSSGAVEHCESQPAPAVPCVFEGDAFAAGTTLPRVLGEVRGLLADGWVADRAYIYDYDWYRRLQGRSYAGDWCASEAARQTASADCPAGSDESWRALARAVRDPSSWDPDRLTLPFTWILVRVGLGWVLLFPLIRLLGGPFYRRRRREVSASPNPLRALLTSDESLVWRARYEKTFGWLLFLLVVSLLIELLPYAVHHFHYLAVRGQSTQSLVIGGLSLVVTLLSGPALAFFDRFGRRVTLVLLSIAGPLLLLTIFVLTTEYAVYAPPGGALDSVLAWLPGQWQLWTVEDGRRFLDPAAAGALFALVALASYVLAGLVDINATSLHGLYRDRLSRAFLVGLDTGGTIEPEEDLSLSQICPPGSGAPYHLINAALNLQGSRDRSLRGRKSDPFLFSSLWVGGQRTGYCRTKNLERLRPELHLGSAMAVSAAAVSPNMGRFTQSSVAVLLSLVNARLALWVPSPAAVRRYFAATETPLLRNPQDMPVSLWRRFHLRTPATLLVRELLGRVHDRGPVVNVSDGGHIENTGAIELLRRRCRFIVLVDGEADPDRAFSGFASLQRFARLDMAIDIDLELDALRPDDEGLSRRLTAAGTIRYPATASEPAGEGYLLYIKLGVTGRERATAAEYRQKNREFPHQSTGDQAFDEAQFEAYRELGYAAGEELMAAAENARELSRFARFAAWFAGLAQPSRPPRPDAEAP